MGYLSSRAINLLNSHFAVFILGMSMIQLYLGLALYVHGLPLALILWFYAALFGARSVARLLVGFPLLRRLGLARGLALGSLLYVGELLLMSRIGAWSNGRLLPLLVGWVAVTDAFYWTAYHAAFANGTAEAFSGRHYGARDAMATATRLMAPLLSGAVASQWGTGALFGVGAGAVLGSLGPLLWLANQRIPARDEGWRSAISRIGLANARIYSACGVYEAGNSLLWSFVVFALVDERFLAYGGVYTAAAVVGIGGSLLAGRWADGAQLGRTRRLGLLLVGLAFAGKLLATHVVVATLADGLTLLAWALLNPVLNSEVARYHRRSGDVLRSAAMNEFGWDAGACPTFAVLGLLAWAGVPMRLLLGVGVVGWLMLSRFLAEGHAARLPQVAAP